MKFDGWYDLLTPQAAEKAVEDLVLADNADDVALPQLRSTMAKAYRRGVRSVVQDVPTDIRGINDAAEAYARERAGELAQGLTREAQLVIKRLTARAIHKGMTDAEMAGILKSKIGLTQQWADAVENYYRGLVAKDVPAGQARSMAHDYELRLKAHRAMTIARTEVQRALNEGQRDVWKASMEAGDLPPWAERVWIIHPSEANCAICKSLNTLHAPLLGTYSTSAGDLEGPPAHPRCRCFELLDTTTGVTKFNRLHDGLGRFTVAGRGGATSAPANDYGSGGSRLRSMGGRRVAAGEAKLRRGDARNVSREIEPSFTNHGSGHVMKGSEVGQTYERLLGAKASKTIARRLGVKGFSQTTSSGKGANTPIDLVFGNQSKRGGHFVAELKTLSINSKDGKSSISGAALRRKLQAARKQGGRPLTVIQVVDQKRHTIHVFMVKDAFVSVRTKSRKPDFSYRYTDRDFDNAQKASGHYDKRAARRRQQGMAA